MNGYLIATIGVASAWAICTCAHQWANSKTGKGHWWGVGALALITLALGTIIEAAR